MGLFTKDIASLDDLFVHQLQDIYYAENQITKALPTMIEKATNAQLKQGFENHLSETQNHIRRLEQVFQMHGQSPKGVDCPAIDGIIEEADEVAAGALEVDIVPSPPSGRFQAVSHRQPVLAVLERGFAIVAGLVLAENSVIRLLDQLSLAFALVFDLVDFLIGQLPHGWHLTLTFFH